MDPASSSSSFPDTANQAEGNIDPTALKDTEDGKKEKHWYPPVPPSTAVQNRRRRFCLSGLKACLQCRAQRLPCSRQVWVPGVKDPARVACRRCCVRDGNGNGNGDGGGDGVRCLVPASELPWWDIEFAKWGSLRQQLAKPYPGLKAMREKYGKERENAKLGIAPVPEKWVFAGAMGDGDGVIIGDTEREELQREILRRANGVTAEVVGGRLEYVWTDRFALPKRPYRWPPSPSLEEVDRQWA